MPVRKHYTRHTRRICYIHMHGFKAYFRHPAVVIGFNSLAVVSRLKKLGVHQLLALRSSRAACKGELHKIISLECRRVELEEGRIHELLWYGKSSL